MQDGQVTCLLPRRAPSPQVPPPGRGRRLRGWSDAEQHKAQKTGLAGPRVVGSRGGGGRPRFSRFIPAVTFPTWPRPSCRPPGLPGSRGRPACLSHGEGTFSICTASRGRSARLSSYIPFTKNNRDLKTRARISREKVRWKNAVREPASGMGAPETPPARVHPPPHASCGAFPSAAWAARAVEGLGPRPGSVLPSPTKAPAGLVVPRLYLYF